MGFLSYANLGETSAATRHSREATGAPADPRLRVMAVLSAIFNCLALNLALLVACLPIVTIPAALQAAIVALDRWRGEGEDRVVREYVAALRSRPFLHTSLAAGGPLAAAALALEEVHFFSRGGSAVNWVCLGLGVDALLLSLASFGYVLVLGARQTDLSVTDLWYWSVSLAVRNLFWTSPLLAAEFAAVVFLLLADPALALIGLPLALASLVRLTADPAIRRADLRAPRAATEFDNTEDGKW
jgi:uncharacterized membrane protein YccF (DUF307 family)